MGMLKLALLAYKTSSQNISSSMALKNFIICAMVSMVVNASGSDTGMLSQCAVEGTQVQFTCPGATIWYVGSSPYDDEMPPLETLTLNASQATGNSSNVFITCHTWPADEYIDTTLVTVGEGDTQVPLLLTATPLTETSLLLDWEDPFIFGNTSYEVVLTVGEDKVMLTTTVSSVELELEGSECQPFQVAVSMPGTCTPATLNGSLLLDPPYPKPENIYTEILKNKSLVLTWDHPDTNEENFTYVIMVLDDKRVVEERVVTLLSSESPREEFNLTAVEVCGEVTVTLIQLGDCREQIVTTKIPMFPGEFLSEIMAEVFFLRGGDLGLVQLSFQPPELCEYQMKTARYLLTISDGGRNWTVGPQSLGHDVVFPDRGQQFVRDQEYTVTATVITNQGNVSSTTNFSTLSLLAEAKLDENSLDISVSDDSVGLRVSWSNPTNTLNIYFAYEICTVLVDTGEKIGEDLIVLPKYGRPAVEFSLDQHVCEKVNISVQIFSSTEIIYKLTTIPARPHTFQKNVTASTFMIDGKIKELEIAFTPPRLCEFQRASYIMSFSSDSEEWSMEPVIISDTGREIKEDIETGFVRNKNYTLTVTIMIDNFDNITSSDDFIFFHEEEMLDPSTSTTTSHPSTDPTFITPTTTSPTETSPSRSLLPKVAPLEPRGSMSPSDMGTIAVGISILAVVCMCLIVGVGVCYLRAKRKRRLGKTPQPNVTNPIYEAGDDVYEELPDLLKDKQSCTEGATYCDVAPPLPSARYDHLPPALAPPPATKLQDQNGDNTDSISKTPKRDPTEKKTEDLLTLPSSNSSSGLSVHSTEDCYTVMNPAGTVTVMPRARGSGLGSQWGASPAGE